MKTTARLFLLFLIACSPAAGDAFTTETMPPAEAVSSSPPATPKSLTPEALEATIFESASAPSFDYHDDGYIGTVFNSDEFSLEPQSSNLPSSTVPEPATLVLLGSGIALAALRRRRA